LATIVFGIWQGNLLSAAEDVAASTKTELSDAKRLYEIALDTANAADAWKDTCYYSSWCWASTYVTAVDDANTAHAVASAYSSEVTRLKTALSDAEDELERYSSSQKIAWIVGGLGTAGSGVWAFTAQSREKRKGSS
jgi:hypothetical protein